MRHAERKQPYIYMPVCHFAVDRSCVTERLITRQIRGDTLFFRYERESHMYSRRQTLLFQLRG